MKKIIVLALVLYFTNAQAKEIYATFTIHAKQGANLAFNYSGIIKELHVDIMSVVKKDDILATLASEDLVATNNASKVTLKYAILDHKRHQDLYQKNLIDKALLDKYAMAYEAIKAKIDVENAIYDKTILRAPFDGVITKRMIELGDVVSGQMIKTAFNLQSEHARILVVEFDQKYNSDVNIGDTFLYKVDGDDTQYEGEIYRIYPEANSDNRKIALQVIAKDLKVGLFGEGKIITSDDSNNSIKASQE
ncbi:efflux RND transporter periplasmic adaptor subunit [Paraglaciecola sp. MB-3u-78]|jgi:membrane fusion protein (multidrug efflux system)|uniref:efflux RND transporter periplasmic adaptor subunit n=1 Tax=Paraglaciecola sp. MB-3u-78 TaxID=2058332 RepID=UPI000C34E361|nr:HlyD family efflux transporter periplasmic adaptor subunit [Paraglaciecola sp. MB-3u-78]PKG97078.1 HlyD family secretion protein [Paraglaciecola sp. MB-3u-78]